MAAYTTLDGTIHELPQLAKRTLCFNDLKIGDVFAYSDVGEVVVGLKTSPTDFAFIGGVRKPIYTPHFPAPTERDLVLCTQF